MARGVALSTAFMHGAAPMEAARALELLQRAGADGVILDAALTEPRLEALLAALAPALSALPIVAVEAPCPAGRHLFASLCATDRAEARVAFESVEASVRRAGTLGAEHAIVRLGAVDALAAEWAPARDRFLRGELDAARGRRLARMRDDAAGHALDVGRRALDRLVRTAEDAGVTLLLANPRRFVELPSPRELDGLLTDFAGAPLAPLLDVACAHLPDVMGVWPLLHTATAFGSRAPLVYLGDACGPVGGLEPGRGELDVGAIAQSLPIGCRVAFRPWVGLAPDEIVRALAAVERLAPPSSGDAVIIGPEPAR